MAKLESAALQAGNKNVTISEIASVQGSFRFMSDAAPAISVAFTALSRMTCRYTLKQVKVNPPGTEAEKQWY